MRYMPDPAFLVLWIALRFRVMENNFYKYLGRFERFGMRQWK